MSWQKPGLFAAGALVIALLIGGAYFGLVQHQPSPSTELPPVSPTSEQYTPTPVPTETISPTSAATQYNTYLDTQSDFSFQYPKAWIIKEEQEKPFQNASASLYFTVTTGVVDNNGPQWGGFSISIYPNPKELPLQKWIADNIPDVKTQPSDKKFGDALEVVEVTSPTGFYLVRTSKRIYSFSVSPSSTFNVMGEGSLVPSSIHFAN